MTKALFAGSFDPFTIGHKSIVDRALSFVDEVVIGIGINTDKKGMFSFEQRKEAISNLFSNEPRVSVETYEGLTVDFAKSIGANVLLRGVRKVADFEYERDMAEINKELSGIETILLFADEKYSCVSSSVVRELIKFGKDVSKFMP